MLRRRMGLLNLPCIAPTVVAALLLVSSVLIGGCGGSAVMIDVTVTGLPPESRLVQVSAQLNGQFANEVTRSLSGAPSSFLVRLPSGSRGLLKLTASGLPENGCAEAEGTAEQTIDADATYKLTIALQPLAVPSCQVAVELVGPGEGSVRMSADGVSDMNCVRTCAGSGGCTTPTRCTMRTRYAGEVRMQASPGGSSYFSNWAGVCSGREVCKRTVERAENVVRANFINPPVCSGGNWCWDYPLPQGGNLYNVKARAANDVWAVGDSGLILHWDGSRWAQVSSGQTGEIRSIALGPNGTTFFGGYTQFLMKWDGQTIDKGAYVGKPASLMWTADGNEIWYSEDFFGEANTGLYRLRGDTGNIDDFMMPMTKIYEIWGINKDDVWISAGDKLYRWNGSSLSERPIPANSEIYGLTGFSWDDIWGIGNGLYHWDGMSWALANSEIKGTAIGASSPNDMWIFGDKLYRFNGKSWNGFEYPKNNQSVSYAGNDFNNLWSVGNNGYISHWDGQKWFEIASREDGYLYSLWGSSPNDVWAAGDPKNILHWDGVSWSELRISEDGRWRAIWGTSANDVLICGATCYHWNGSTWAQVSHPKLGETVVSLWGTSNQSVWATTGLGKIYYWNGILWAEQFPEQGLPAWSKMWGNSDSNVWCVLDNNSYHFDGKSWKKIELVPRNLGALFSVFGFSDNDVWAVGMPGLIMHWDGASWSRKSVGILDVLPMDNYLSGFWGSSPSDSWVIGPRGLMLRAYRDVFNPVPTGTVNRLWTIWGAGPQDVWVAGERSTILRYRP